MCHLTVLFSFELNTFIKFRKISLELIVSASVLRVDDSSYNDAARTQSIQLHTQRERKKAAEDDLSCERKLSPLLLKVGDLFSQRNL